MAVEGYNPRAKCAPFLRLLWLYSEVRDRSWTSTCRSSRDTSIRGPGNIEDPHPWSHLLLSQGWRWLGEPAGQGQQRLDQLPPWRAISRRVPWHPQSRALCPSWLLRRPRRSKPGSASGSAKDYRDL